MIPRLGPQCDAAENVVQRLWCRSGGRLLAAAELPLALEVVAHRLLQADEGGLLVAREVGRVDALVRAAAQVREAAREARRMRRSI